MRVLLLLLLLWLCSAARLRQKATKLHGKPASKRATNFAKKMTGQNNALHIAARAGHGHVVRWLRTCPATKALFNVTAKGEGLENAFKKGQGHPVVMRELLKCKQGCEYVAKTGLMKYAKNLELGGMAAWVYNTYKEDEKTLPMIALEAGHFKMAEYLDDLLDKARRREFEEAEQKMLETAARAANQGDSTDMEIDQLSAGAKAKQDRKAAMLQKFQDKQAAHAQRLQAVRNQEEALSSPSRAGANDLEARVKAAAQVPLAAGDKCTLAEDYHDQDMNAQHGVLRPGEVGVVNYIKEPDSEGMVFISVRANDGQSPARPCGSATITLARWWLALLWWRSPRCACTCAHIYLCLCVPVCMCACVCGGRSGCTCIRACNFI